MTGPDIPGSKAAAALVPSDERSNALDSISHTSEVPDASRIQIMCFSSSEKETDLGIDCVSQREMIVPRDVSRTWQADSLHVIAIFPEGEIAIDRMRPELKSSQTSCPDRESHTPTRYPDHGESKRSGITDIRHLPSEENRRDRTAEDVDDESPELVLSEKSMKSCLEMEMNFVLSGEKTTSVILCAGKARTRSVIRPV